MPSSRGIKSGAGDRMMDEDVVADCGNVVGDDSLSGHRGCRDMQSAAGAGHRVCAPS